MQLAYPETYMCIFGSLCKCFFPVQIDIFSVLFCQGELRKQSNFTFCWFWLGKMHRNCLSVGIFRVWGMPNAMPQVLSLCDKRFLKNHNFRQKFHIWLILMGRNASKLVEWCIFRFQGMPNPMAFVVSLFDKWFMKNHNFRRHIAENGFKTMKMGWDICSSPPWFPFYSYTMLQNPISWPSHKNAEKP